MMAGTKVTNPGAEDTVVFLVNMKSAPGGRSLDSISFRQYKLICFLLLIIWMLKRQRRDELTIIAYKLLISTKSF
jgi:hypothetical protein